MYHLSFKNYIYPNTKLNVWVAGNMHNLISSDGRLLSDTLHQAYDFFGSIPLMVMPIPERQGQGEILKDIFLLKPMHIMYEVPEVFAINNKFITEYSGFKQFFTKPVQSIEKIMNLDMLQALSDEKGFHMIGLYQADEEIDENTALEEETNIT